MIAKRIFGEPLSPAEKQKRHREKRAERERNAILLVSELLTVAPSADVARLEADERFTDIIEATRQRAE